MPIPLETQHASILRDLAAVQEMHAAKRRQLAKAAPATLRKERLAFVPVSSILKSHRPAKRIEQPADRLETWEELHSRIRAKIPGILAKSMEDFRAGRITAIEVSTIQAKLHQIEMIIR